MRRYVSVLVLGAIALTAIPMTAQAAPTIVYTTLPAGANWAWTQVTPPPTGTLSPCVGFTFHGNVTYTGSASVSAYWAWGVGTGIGTGLVVPASADRLMISDGTTTTTVFGTRPNWGGQPDELVVNFETFVGKICGNTLQRVGFIMPDVVDGYVQWRFDWPTTVVGGASGSNGFQWRPEDFKGTYVDLGLGDPADFDGASAALNLVAPTKTLPRGMMAAFWTDDLFARLSASGPGAFGTKSADCVTTPPQFFVRVQNCNSGGIDFGSLGGGYRVSAPAGTYTFRVEREASAEPLHVYVVGAPFDWRP